MDVHIGGQQAGEAVVALQRADEHHQVRHQTGLMKLTPGRQPVRVVDRDRARRHRGDGGEDAQIHRGAP